MTPPTHDQGNVTPTQPAARKPTPTQRAILEELARRRRAGLRACIEIEVDGKGKEYAPRLALKNGATRYVEEVKVTPQTLRLLRAAGWIVEVSRETIAAVTHGRKQWHTEHVEYAITAAGRAAIAPAKPKAKGTGAEQQQTRTSRSATTRRAKPSTKAGRETT